jgi:hypothetical protein
MTSHDLRYGDDDDVEHTVVDVRALPREPLTDQVRRVRQEPLTEACVRPAHSSAVAPAPYAAWPAARADGWTLAWVLRACRLRQEPLPAAVACYIAAEVGSGTGSENRRDAGLEDIWLGRGGTVERTVGGSAPPGPDEPTSAAYYPPIHEVISEVTRMGAPAASAREIAALGALLYECLTLRSVPGAVAERSALAAPSTLAAGVPPALDELVRRAFASEGGYRSSDALLTALALIRKELPADAAALARCLDGMAGALEPTPPKEQDPAENGQNRNDDEPAMEVVREQSTVVSRRLTGRWRQRLRQLIDPPVERRWRMTAMVALLAFGCSSAWHLGQRSAEDSRAAAVAAAAAVSAPPAVAAPAVASPAVAPPAVASPPVTATAPSPTAVRLRLSGLAGAQVLVDDVAVGVLPLDVHLAGSSDVRVIVVKRPGYRPWTRTVAGGVDVSSTVELERLPQSRGG